MLEYAKFVFGRGRGSRARSPLESSPRSSDVYKDTIICYEAEATPGKANLTKPWFDIRLVAYLLCRCYVNDVICKS